MKILIVSATLFEVKKLAERQYMTETIPNHMYKFAIGRMQVHLLTPGIGLLHTAFWLGKILQEGAYELTVNAGICGSYRPDIPLGSVLHVTEEQLPEPGIYEDGTFRSLFELGLMPPDEDPFEEGKLVNRLFPKLNAIRNLQRVTGNTVSTMQTDPGRIQTLLTRFPADVESMEGAAVMFACLSEKIPCFQIRAVSNYVGERNKERWDIHKAIRNLDEKMSEILEEVNE